MFPNDRPFGAHVGALCILVCADYQPDDTPQLFLPTPAHVSKGEYPVGKVSHLGKSFGQGGV